MTRWENCRNVLCVRLDNMGDLIMSAPALAALKKTYACRITLLTSSQARGMADFITAIDDVLTFDVPWVKNDGPTGREAMATLIQQIRSRHFDAAVIFTTFSQNPLPTAMMLYEAGIARTLAYCRENPYSLLSHWVPDAEPYSFIRHQVQRDLDLVQHIGVETAHDDVLLRSPAESVWQHVYEKIRSLGIRPDKPWIVVHPGVSEVKREYPLAHWKDACRILHTHYGIQFVVTGTEREIPIANELVEALPHATVSLAGMLPLEGFMALLRQARLVVTVNTATAHIAAAFHTPLVVLYALTNPQHVPWKGRGYVLPYPVPPGLRSKNEVLRHLQETCFAEATEVHPEDIVQAVCSVLLLKEIPAMPELVTGRTLTLV
ncbi:glycosyltransferase family 9 protein [Fulvivirgaceae bacterium PWU5]|uniref:Glycosyltransferase family 9 protein n=1 Tax=Dawidia cretensis TaxID=2782350 RepID=A0AAP2GTF2_9BACT|nr:glycosyltransferase family 9 protein [Dawidia cretensis]MBT1708163.1 glycosyltransferase family 9 protein [Dawidia cretensis]